MHEYQISAHYIIDEQGNITKLVNESKRAYHAGGGILAREKSAVPTPRSIGIELVNFSLGQNAYAPAQIEKLIFFLKKTDK